MTPDDITHRFTHHPPTPERVRQHEAVRALLANAAHELNDRLPEGDEKRQALLRLEETLFWANAAIARQKES